MTDLIARGIAASALGRIVGQPLLCCANRGRIPSHRTVAATNSLRAETRRLYSLGRTAWSEIRVSVANFLVDGDGTIFGGGAGQEYNPGNSFVYEAAIEIPGAPNPVVRFTWNGGTTATVPDGATDFLSDALYPWQFGLVTFPANMVYWLRERRDVSAVGQLLVRFGSVSGDISGEITQMSNGASASQVNAQGAMTTPAGGAQISACFAPACFVGRAIGVPDIAVLGVGDSLVQGSNDAIFGGASNGANGRGGWFTRGLWSTAGGPGGATGAVPHMLMSFNGSTVFSAMEQPNMGAAFAKRRAYLKYFTHAYEGWGTNDFGGSPSQTAAQTYLRKQKLWRALRSGDSSIRHITAGLIFPRTNSTDSFATVANQTPRAGYAVGSTFRDPLNANILASLASLEIDAVFNPGQYLADGTFTDRWLAGFTDDGTHPTVTGQNALTPPWQSLVATFT